MDLEYLVGMVRSISLKWRAVFGVMVLTITALVLVGVVQMHFMRADLARVLADQQFALVSRVAQGLDSKFETYTEVLVRSAASFPRELINSPAGARAHYAARSAMLAAFDDLIVLRPDGTVVADYPEVPGRAAISAAGRPYFDKLLATRKPVIAEPVLSRARGEPIAQIAVPILDADGKLVGALVAVLRLYKRNFLADLAGAKVGKTGYFVIITKEAQPRYVIHPDPRRILQPRPMNGTASTTEALLQGLEGTVEDTSIAGVRLLYSYKSLKSVDWLLVAAVPTQEAYSPIVEAQQRLWLICLVVALLVAPLVWSLAWLILRPVAQLRDEIDRLRGGAPDYRPVPALQRDEIGDLARSFNALMQERTAAEQKQRATEERLRTITDNLPALIAYMGIDERYQFVNRTFAVWFGRPFEDYVGRSLREVVGDPAYTQVVGPMAARALAGETVSYQRTMHDDGEPRDIEVTFVPDRTALGDVAGLYVLINDISALKRTKDQLRALNTDLEERVRERTAALELSNRELETFAYSVAHDFRAPLRAMDGYSAILMNEHGPQLDVQGRDYLERIRASSTRLGRLIDDLLRLAQLAQQEIKVETVDLSLLAGQVIEDLRAAWPERRVEAVIEPRLTVRGDRVLLAALLRELIENAWKFTAARPDARIELGRGPGAGGALFVRDNGIGFAMEFAQQVFSPFVRLHGTDEFSGTGTGLALAKRIVCRHGGRIWAQAQPGQGAAFWFTLGD